MKMCYNITYIMHYVKYNRNDNFVVIHCNTNGDINICHLQT